LQLRTILLPSAVLWRLSWQQKQPGASSLWPRWSIDVGAPGDLHPTEHVPGVDVARRLAGSLDLRCHPGGRVGVVHLVDGADLLRDAGGTRVVRRILALAVSTRFASRLTRGSVLSMRPS
jgi:hypothetical protein